MSKTPQQKWNKTQGAINQASSTAAKHIPGWNDDAYDMLVTYCTVADHAFCADMVREWATKQGLPEPPSRLAWGGIFRKASTAGVIERAGIRNYHYPNSNCTHTQTNTFWRAII